MKKVYLLSVLFGLLTVGGCQNEREVQYADNSQQKEQPNTSSSSLKMYNVPPGAAVPGEIIIKITDEVEQSLTQAQLGEVQMSSVPSSMGSALQSIKATAITRLFPPAGEFEERSRKEGLHLWFIVRFDKGVEISRAMQALDSVDGVEIVEFNPVIVPASANQHPAAINLLSSTEDYLKRNAKMPFNDPLLKEQWHYNNIGTGVPAGVMGSDINLFKAWEISTGTPNVIVCVVDGGVDVDHPDLADNMWVNQAEQNGTSGVDDDNNGFVDDINGYCFVTDQGNLRPDEDAHGTHVAGTIAAKNNNGVGVAGVAGGNGDPNTGVRIMSAAIFREGAQGGNAAAAIKYGADNGAVISQNSWGYPYRSGVYTTPNSLKVAIDYFVKYAGTDGKGNQRPDSPMKGGVVLFAAGNDGLEFTSQPAAYEGCIAVSAIGTNFKRATYSNYGDWVDISAPGGDQMLYGTKAGVLSTTDKNAANVADWYTYYQGTSMACPHASGVAALIVSHFGGPGFTSEDLKTRLLASILPVDIDKINPGAAGRLGSGYVDAYAALTLKNDQKAPESPKFNSSKINANVNFTELTLFWNVPKDEDDGTADKYAVYMSTTPLNANNYKKEGELISNPLVGGKGLSVNDEVSFVVKKLTPDKEYHFALVAIDRWNLFSAPSFISVKTKKNNPPVISNVPENPLVLLNILGKVEYEFNISDPDGHKWQYTLEDKTNCVSVARIDKGLKVTIRPLSSAGEYSFNLKLTDELKSSFTYTIPFRIVTVTEPEFKKAFPTPTIGAKGEGASLNLADYVTPQEFLTFTYKASSSNGSVASADVDDKGKLTIKGYKPGRTTISVEVSNGHMSSMASFSVTVVEDPSLDVYSVWPLPMQKELNVWLNPTHKKAHITLISVTGAVVLDKEVPADHTGVAKINTSKVAPGTYTLKVKTGGKPYERAVQKR